MKKLLSALAIAAASTALAVESSNTFGILRVTIPAGQQNTVIAAPWCDAGATGDAQKSIKVKDIVKTANLTPATTADNGDKLYVFNGKNYSSAFQLQTVDGIVKWVGIRINGAAAGTDETAIQRGQAIVLALNTAPESATDIYLYGQYTTVGASTTIAKGSAETPAYTLVAPVTTSNDGTSLDSLAKAAIPAVDTVLVKDSSGNQRALVCRQHSDSSYKWGIVTYAGMGGAERFTPISITIPAGEGFWYISRSTQTPESL